MTLISSARTRWMKKLSSSCAELFGHLRSPSTAGPSRTLKPSLLQPSGKSSPARPSVKKNSKETAMIFSHTQMSQYLRCPRSYRYRYLDGWQEKETRAAMMFGRSFETALYAYFCREDPTAALFK